jgi:hypothetical protein
MAGERTDWSFIKDSRGCLPSAGRASGRARHVGVTDAPLSLILRQADYKTASPELARRVSRTLGLGSDDIAEACDGYVLERIRWASQLRDELFDRLSTE